MHWLLHPIENQNYQFIPLLLIKLSIQRTGPFVVKKIILECQAILFFQGIDCVNSNTMGHGFKEAFVSFYRLCRHKKIMSTNSDASSGHPHCYYGFISYVRTSQIEINFGRKWYGCLNYKVIVSTYCLFSVQADNVRDLF